MASITITIPSSEAVSSVPSAAEEEVVAQRGMGPEQSHTAIPGAGSPSQGPGGSCEEGP